MSDERPEEFIIDADVLIDYRDSDISVLTLFSMQVGQLHVGRATLQKVRYVSEAQAKRNKLAVETPDLELAVKASQARGKLSYDDHETLLLAVQNNWICISNDIALRTECGKEGIELLWGLEPMKYLVKDSELPLNKALSIATMIQKGNPGYITDSILNRFEKQIRELVK